jgi:hypothetical protein
MNTQIAEHVVIHLGEFGHGAADFQFGFDRPLHFRHERYNSCYKPRNKTRSRSPPFDAHTMDFVERLS